LGKRWLLPNPVDPGVAKGTKWLELDFLTRSGCEFLVNWTPEFKRHLVSAPRPAFRKILGGSEIQAYQPSLMLESRW
jgi:hypothetical protein